MKNYQATKWNLAILLIILAGTVQGVGAQGFSGYRINYEEYGINVQGTEECCLPPIYDVSHTYPEDTKLFSVKKAGRYGFVDRENNTIIPFQYVSAHFFWNNMVTVEDEDDGLVYVINLKGEKIAGPYKKAMNLNEFMEVLDMDGKYRLYDLSFKPLSERAYDHLMNIPASDNINDRYYLARYEGKYGIVDNADRIMVPFQYDTIVYYTNEILKAIPYKQRKKLNPKAEDFTDIFMVGKKNPKYQYVDIWNYGLITMKGDELVPVKESIYGINLKAQKMWKKKLLPYMLQKEDNKRWLLSRLENGRKANLERAKDYLSSLPQDYVHPTKKQVVVKKGKKGQTLTVNGKPAGTYAQVTKHDRNYIVKAANGKYGLLDENAGSLLNCEYDRIEVFRDMHQGGSTFKMVKGGKEGLIFADGTVALPAWYERIDSVPGHYFYIVKDQNEYFTVKRTGTRLQNYNYTRCEYNPEQKNVTVELPFYDQPITLASTGNDDLRRFVLNRVGSETDVNQRARFASLALSLWDNGDKYDRIRLYQDIAGKLKSNGDYDLAMDVLLKGERLGSLECRKERDGIYHKVHYQNTPSESLLDIGLGLLNSVGGLLNGGKPLTDPSLNSFDGGTGLDNGSSSSGGSSNPHPGRDYNYYKTQYDRWARNAKSVYESLTLMGSKTKTDGKYTSGNTNQLYNGPSYVSMKQNLRHAQTQMRNYRQEARRAGHNIPKSEYETVTVSY